jgi:hypothetical protein
MNEAKAFGLTGAAAKQLAGVQTLQSRGIHTTGRARGGLVQFGRPGDRGPDSIPAMFGSQPVVVGSGEVGAVFNGPQIAEMNAELAHRGGLRGFFDRKRWPRHSEGTPARAERGGVVKGYARGGVADFGGHPQNVAPGIRRLIAVMQSHFPLGVTSTTDHSLMTTSGNVSDHSTGHAVDLASSPSIMFRAAEWIKRSGLAHSLKQGIHNPNLAVNAGQIEKPPGIFGGEVWAQHANHIHLALAGALGKFSGAALEHIKRIVIGGPDSPLKSIVQHAIDRVRAGANKKLDGLSSQMGDFGATGPAPHVKGTYGLHQLEQLWLAAGGQPKYAALMGHVALAESSGNPNAHNPSGATGLWQIKGAVRPGDLTDPMVNARNAVAKFNAASITGHPLGPWVSSIGGWRRYTHGLPYGGIVGAPDGLMTWRSATRPRRRALQPLRPVRAPRAADERPPVRPAQGALAPPAPACRLPDRVVGPPRPPPPPPPAALRPAHRPRGQARPPLRPPHRRRDVALPAALGEAGQASRAHAAAGARRAPATSTRSRTASRAARRASCPATRAGA